MDICILYLIIIDSYEAHSIETYLNRPEIIIKPVWHVWTVKISFLQGNSVHGQIKSWPRTISNLNSLYMYITSIALV